MIFQKLAIFLLVSLLLSETKGQTHFHGHVRGLGRPQSGQADTLVGSTWDRFLKNGPPNDGFGPKKGGPPGLRDVFDEYLTSITCPEVADVPECQPPPNPRKSSFDDISIDGDGTWVCRTLYNPVTGETLEPQTICIDGEDGALSTDVCGCCEPDGCPSICDCGCTTRNNEDGVLVDFEVESDDGDEDSLDLTTECLPSSVAVSIIALSQGAVTCNTSCST